ncbi:MAG: dicarboxylate/amino acid:cation symporter [Planctomycetota bacterium]
MSKHNLLSLLIVIGLALGVVVGQIIFRDTGGIDADHWSKLAGDLILIRPLKLLIVPIVFVSVLVGVTSIGDPSKLGVVGGSTVLYYLATMLIAVTIGTTLVSTIQPGELSDDARTMLTEGAAESYAESSQAKSIAAAQEEGSDSIGRAFFNVVQQMIPTNIIDEMANGRTLGIIVFALAFGLALAAGGEATQPAVRGFEALFDGIMRLVMWVIWITPLGVFLLMTYTVGSIGLGNLVGPISKYIFTVLLGLMIHGAIVLPIILFIITRGNPFRFMYQMRRALLTAFGTDSSSATLPVTIETAESEGGCSKRAANFVLPLGATINMDGTALYEAVAVVFLFQLYGIDLSLGQLVVVVVTATLAAIGAAGIPSAGIVMMVIVINAVNTSLGGSAESSLPLSAIGVIIGVDRIVDMCRTTVNVWGDAVGAKIISTIAPDDLELAPDA